MKYLALPLFLLSAAACAAQIVIKPTIVQAVTHAAGLEARIMWMDATGNLDNLDTQAKVADVMEKCRRANINTVVVDIKPLIGETLYPSKIAPRLTTYRGKNYDPNFDLMRVALDEGRKRGLKVYASINTLTEGHKLVGRGPAYDHPEWQAISYVADRAIVTDEGSYTVWPILGDPPPTDGISVYAPTAGPAKTARPGEVYSIIADNVVQVTVGGAAVAEPTAPIPPNGFVLAGNGAAAQWMADKLRPGVAVRWEVQDRLVPISQAPTERVSVFVNPLQPEARAREIAIIREIAANYDLDGIVFDRMRYSSLTTDFSDLSRRTFEQWAGVKIQNWPADIYQYPADPTQEIIRGPYFEKWLEWRARVIHKFTEEAIRTVHAARPTAKCAVYVGSWYPVYYGVGVNWASDEYNAQYDWMTDAYHKTGYAPLLDWICTGTYYAEPFRAGARAAGKDPDATVEAGAQLSNVVVSDASFVYGSLNLPDYQGRPGPFMQAIQASLQESQGVMLFDLVYVIQYGLWGVLQQAFPQPAIAPHDVPDLLKRIQDVRAILPSAPEKTLGASQNWKLVVPE